MSEKWFFDQNYAKHLCQNFKRRIESKRTGFIFRQVKDKCSEDFALLIDGLITHGLNRNAEELVQEFKELSQKLKSKKIYLAYFYLIGPAIRNELLKKLAIIEGYPSTGALELDLIFELLMPLFKNIYAHFDLINIEACLLARTIIFEYPLDLKSREEFFPTFPESSGFLESQFLINTDPIRPRIEKTEHKIKEKKKRVIRDLQGKTNLLDVMRQRLQKKEVDLNAVSTVFNPIQQITVGADEIERYIRTSIIKKKKFEEHERKDLMKILDKIVRRVWDDNAIEISKMKENQPLKYFRDINNKFTDYMFEDKQIIEKRLIKTHQKNFRMRQMDFSIGRNSHEITEVDRKIMKKDCIPDYKQIAGIIFEILDAYVDKIIDKS
ncbi:MAG: hypothetical protein ACTSRW_15460 [Candidatus Helarchaeota archaeon]